MKRSRHLGVYNNSDTDQPFRVAIKRYINDKPHYQNVGYFDTEDAAACVYNIYALCSFGKGAVLNNVEVTDEVELEILEYLSTRPGFLGMIEQATNVMEQENVQIRVNKHE